MPEMYTIGYGNQTIDRILDAKQDHSNMSQGL
jgi:hypothetical protein